MNAREEVLGRLRAALADHPAPGPVPRDYRQTGDAGPDTLVDRLRDYGAAVRRCPVDRLAAIIAQALSERGTARVVVAHDAPETRLSEVECEILRDSGQLSPTELDRVDGVVTTCAVAIAETGTLVLDGGPGQGRRAITLLPDYHLCVVHADQIAAGVPEALARLDPTRPLTFISGPSATSDIELDRVEGVHGPRTLEVILVEPD